VIVVDTAAGVRPIGYNRPMLNFQKLDVYQRSIEFLALASQVGDHAPKGNAPLLDQLRRAATSIPLNIAEAAGRTGKADMARAYAIARGSAMECAAALDALALLKLVDVGTKDRGDGLLKGVVEMLTRMCR
jgi:four helix bundle protein